MSAGHTPGPWLIMRSTVYALDETSTVNRFSCLPEGGWEVAGKHRTKPDEVEANARLIASAPDYKEARDSLFEAIKHGDEQHQQWLKAAIDAHFAAADARATGAA